MAENQPQTAVLCLFCDQPNVMWKCEECGHFICNLCKEKKHSRLKSSDTHRILLIKEIRKVVNIVFMNIYRLFLGYFFKITVQLEETTAS